MEISSHKKKSSTLSIFIIISILLLLAGGVFFYFTFFESTPPSITIKKNSPYLQKTNILFIHGVDEGTGLKSLTVTAFQKDKNIQLYSNVFPEKNTPWKNKKSGEDISISFNPSEADFADGEIKLTIAATDHSFSSFFKGNTTTIENQYILDTHPPVINSIHTDKYVQRGGSGIVIYSLSDKTDKTGLRINDIFHQGFPLSDGKENTYIAYFGIPYDAENFDNAHIESTDKAGNSSTFSVYSNLKKTQFKNDRINISDGFLDKKIPEFQQHHPEMQGNYLDKYLFTNNKIRKENNNRIKEICTTGSAPEKMWDGKFIRMAGASRAGFADHRTYYYNGDPIDKQVHLGVDIASTRHANIKAANGGVIKYSDYLGIYGQLVIIDHGQGVFSLYSHLSNIKVANGDRVTKGDVIGKSGTTGMAGGDHLHFSMLVNGVFVTPVEWWDYNWIKLNILNPVSLANQ